MLSPRSVSHSAALFALVLTAGLLPAASARAQIATKTATPVPTATATPRLERVVLGPKTAQRQVGQTQNFTATGFYSDGSQKNLTQKVIYSSSDLNVVFPPNEVGNAGRVEAVGVGVATISATEPTTGVNTTATDDSAVMTVVEAPTPTPTSTNPTPTRTFTPIPTATATPKLLSLQLSPVTPKRNVGQTQNFVCTGTYSDGNQKNLTQQCNYASSNSSVADARNETGNKGKVYAVGAGVATISASLAGVTTTASGGDAEFTVVVPPTPTPTRTGPTPTATLSPTPTITATPVVVSLKLAPESASRGLGTTQNFTATATYSDGSTKNFTQRVTYASSNPDVADARNEDGNKGKVYAVGVGTATISAVDELTGIGTNETGNAILTVFLAPTPTPRFTGITPTRTKTPTPTPTATPKLVSLAIGPLTVKKVAGAVQIFSVTGTYSDGNQKNLTQKVEYSSSNQAVAQTGIDPTSKSKVLAVAPGVAIIWATDPATGITIPLDERATFTVTQAPTPTPTHTGPTSTAPTGTKTFTPSPSPTATPVLTEIRLGPKTPQKAIGVFQFFTATGKFSDGSEKNVTQRVTYHSSDPTVAVAENLEGNRGRFMGIKVGVTTISASDETTGVVSTDVDGDAVFTVVEGNGTPNPRVTATPGLPISTGNATTACQRDVRRAARTYVDKKLKALDRCAGAASRCVQRKPGDPDCLGGVKSRCAKVLSKLADDEAKLIAAVIKRCAGLSSSDVLGVDGLAYGDLANSCSVRFGRTLTDLTSVAQCLAAQHSCRAEVLYALERPRAGELLRLVDVSEDAGACREDFGGSGSGVGDPKGLGKLVERCATTLVKGGTTYARDRLASIGRCIDAVFVCVEADVGNPACLPKAAAKCEREFARVQKDVAKLTVAAGKSCNGVDFDVLSGASGAFLDAVVADCPSYGIPTIATLADYVACLVRQHECEVADLVRFESPRAEDLLDQVDRTLVDGTCPAP
jgi:hypothetical protein